ncbi:RNA polymerase sigma factor [Pedobacter frigoris]|uniref:RNA polymerase sigma factor n=1 Tax=Pedobacter frigoris TaxID=2571272 RepID=UPI002931410D|nr:sigma-70 family RNA polymerase sigma factor [Pedobacter frigoris]
MALQHVKDIDQVDLLNRLRDSDEAAFTELYKTYSLQMYANTLKMVKDEQVAEELVQELFTKIWQKRETIEVEVDFKSYLHKIGQNLVYDFFRKLQRDERMYERFKAVATEHYSHIEESLHLKQSEAVLEIALSKLSVQQRKVYQLCKIDGFTYKQTAERMGISPHTVKEYLTKANQIVKQYLLDNLDISMTILLFMFLRK